tara:strand:+ start:3185 stop:3616 length:432 start_codon:yes stop_codon:yes gene_type:complete
MKKGDLKNLIKPIVKECIQEVLIEEGLLSNVVSEVVRGMQTVDLVVESGRKTNHVRTERKQNKSHEGNMPHKEKLNERRKKLMESIGSDTYNGIDLFEGTSPLSAKESGGAAAGSIDLGDPKDSGVDISSLVGNATKLWEMMK